MKSVLSHGLTLAVIGFLLGYIANDFVNFKSFQRELLRTEFNEARETARSIDNQLALLSLVARGEEKPEPKVVSQLGENIIKLRNEADAVSKRVPDAEGQFGDYADAMVELKNAAQQLTGPSNAKDFVEAVSNFYGSRNRFESIVSEHQGHYSLIF